MPWLGPGNAHSFDRIATGVYALAAMNRLLTHSILHVQQPGSFVLVLLLAFLAACEGAKSPPASSAVVLARHIDQLLDDPSRLPREATVEMAEAATPVQQPAATTPTIEKPDAASSAIDAKEVQDLALTPDVVATPDVKSPPDIQASPAVQDVHDALGAKEVPDVQQKPDVLVKPDAAAPPIVPIPVRRDGTPIAKADAAAKPDGKLVKPAPIAAAVKLVPTAVAAKPAKLSAAERKKQAKLAAATAKAEAKAAVKKALQEKKKKAQAQIRDKKKRAAAAKQKKADAKKAAEEAKKAAIAAKKAAAWARKHPNAAKSVPAKPAAGEPVKPVPAPAAKPDAVKPAKVEPAKPIKAEPVKPEAPTSSSGSGDATELFFAGKRKADAGDFRGAIEDFKASQAARPSPRTLTALGRAYFDAGEMNSAAGVLRKAGSHDDAQLLLGTLYQQMDKPEKARKVYEDFLKAHPDHTKAEWVRKLIKTL